MALLFSAKECSGLPIDISPRTTVLQPRMNKLTLLAFVIFLMGCNKLEHKKLLGVWKSNEEKTLESLAENEGITLKMKEVFEEDFFGKLVVEYKRNTYRAMFEDEEDNLEEFKRFYSYEVLEANENELVIKGNTPLLEEDEVKTIYLEGDCYYLFVSKWDFKEYFCRIN